MAAFISHQSKVGPFSCTGSRVKSSMATAASPHVWQSEASFSNVIAKLVIIAARSRRIFAPKGIVIFAVLGRLLVGCCCCSLGAHEGKVSVDRRFVIGKIGKTCAVFVSDSSVEHCKLLPVVPVEVGITVSTALFDCAFAFSVAKRRVVFQVRGQCLDATVGGFLDRNIKIKRRSIFLC